MSDERLKSLVDRAVRVTEDKRALSDDLKDLRKEAKSAGYNPKAFALLVKRQMEDSDKRNERERIEREADELEAALGPLGAAAATKLRNSPPGHEAPRRV